MDMKMAGRSEDATRKIDAREYDEVAESIKITMKALKDYFGLKSSSQEHRLRVVGSEFGHMVSRNIASQGSQEAILSEVGKFWTGYGLGDMRIEETEPLTFTMRDCYDCIGAVAGETLCAFKEGFINAILNDKGGQMGTVKELECCGTGAETCKFTVVPYSHT
jgi:predicted hydrocarbon binding protein